MNGLLALWTVTLFWTQGDSPGLDVTANRVERGTCSAAGGWGTAVAAYDLPPAVSYRLTVPDGPCHAFRVYARNADGWSGPSNVAVYRGPAPGAPTATVILP